MSCSRHPRAYTRAFVSSTRADRRHSEELLGAPVEARQRPQQRHGVRQRALEASLALGARVLAEKAVEHAFLRPTERRHHRPETVDKRVAADAVAAPHAWRRQRSVVARRPHRAARPQRHKRRRCAGRRRIAQVGAAARERRSSGWCTHHERRRDGSQRSATLPRTEARVCNRRQRVSSPQAPARSGG